MSYNRDVMLRDIAEYGLSKADKPFKLAGGGESNYYIDCARLLHAFDFRRRIGLALGGLAGCKFSYEEITGVPYGGLILAATIANQQGLDVPVLRKEAKERGPEQGKYVAGLSLEGLNYDPVLLVEDVITTGGSVIKAIKTLREENLTVAGVVAIVDREAGGLAKIKQETGVGVECFCTLSEVLKYAKP